MSEWLKEHAWKACVRQRTVGSNPTISASDFEDKKGGIRTSKHTLNLKKLRYELQHLDDTQGYTTLGQAKLMTDSERQANEDKKEGLQSQIDETQLAIEELKFKMKKREFLFSGDVTLRRVTQLTKEATPHATN